MAKISYFNDKIPVKIKCITIFKFKLLIGICVSYVLMCNAISDFLTIFSMGAENRNHDVVKGMVCGVNQFLCRFLVISKILFDF